MTATTRRLRPGRAKAGHRAGRADALINLWRGVVLSFRGMFLWLNPVGYLSSRLVYPISLVVIFASLPQGDVSRHRVGIGMPLLAAITAVIFDLTMMVGNERFYGTLELRLTTPQGVMGGIPGKLVAPVGDGLLSGILVMITMVVLGDLRLSRSNAAALLLAVLLSVLGALAAGLVTAAVAIRTNDPFLTPNLLSLVFLLCGGYVADPARLPLRLGAVGAVLPGGHAVSIVMTMTRTGHVPAGPVLGALGVIAAWAVIGLGWLAAMTASARRHGTTAPS